MSPKYTTIRVATGADPFSVLSEIMVRRYGRHDPEYIYRPEERPPERVTHNDDWMLTHMNGEWLDQWHSENPDYELRRATNDNSISNRRAVAMPATDRNLADGHHVIQADLVHVPTQSKVGDMTLSLGKWDNLSGRPEPSRSHVTTAHIWSFYRHNQPEHGEPDPHSGVMGRLVDSWLDHAEDNGIHHGFINTDASHGYWLHNIVKHPNMVWGGVELRSEGDTRSARMIDTDAVNSAEFGKDAWKMVKKRDVLHKHAATLFRGWPSGYRESMDDLDENDAFMMRWNQRHNQPGGTYGPLPVTIKRFVNGRVEEVDGHHDRRCYHHALRNYKASKGRMKLAVGFVVDHDEATNFERGIQTRPPILFLHAFNVTKHGEIHDSTYGGEYNHRYYGRVVPDDVAKTFKKGDDVALWFGRHFQGGRTPHNIHTGQFKDIDHR